MSMHRPARRWRSAVPALVLGMVGPLLGPAGVAGAHPYTGADAPILSAPTGVAFVLGRAGDAYQIEADGDPVPAIGVDRLPPGLRMISHGDGSASIEGTPTGPAGTMTVEVIAQNGAGADTALISVDVQQAPAFVAPGPVRLVAGEPASVVLHTVGYPAPGIGLDGDLPPGLGFVDNGDGTATIYGTPIAGSADAPITLTAINVVADASLTTTVVVEPRPEATADPVKAEPGSRAWGTRQPIDLFSARTGGPRRAP